jgi:hypothetical protein
MLSAARYVGAGVNGEAHIELLPKFWKGDGTKTGILFTHGAGGNELEARNPNYPQVNMLAFLETFVEAGFPVLSCYLGGDQWGNASAVSKVTAARSYLSATMGASSTRVAFVAQSMGHLSAMNWIAASAGNKAAAAFVISSMGVCDLQNIYAGGGYTASINAAYGGAYNNATQGPASNPTTNAATKYAGLNWLGFVGTSDTTAPAAQAQALATAIGSTARLITPGGSHDWQTVANWDRQAAIDFAVAYQ